MQFSFRTLLIALALGPSLIVAVWLIAIPFLEATDPDAPAVLAVAAMLYSPFWLPAAWIAWQFKRDRFSRVGCCVFLVLEALSIVLSRFVAANLPD
jgi:hypothetical protein